MLPAQQQKPKTQKKTQHRLTKYSLPACQPAAAPQSGSNQHYTCARVLCHSCGCCLDVVLVQSKGIITIRLVSTSFYVHWSWTGRCVDICSRDFVQNREKSGKNRTSLWKLSLHNIFRAILHVVLHPFIMTLHWLAVILDHSLTTLFCPAIDLLDCNFSSACVVSRGVSVWGKKIREVPPIHLDCNCEQKAVQSHTD